MTNTPGNHGTAEGRPAERSGIVFLLATLAVEIPLASFPVASTTQHLTTALVGMALAMLAPWCFPSALARYARANRPVLALACVFLSVCAVSAFASPFPKVHAIKGLMRYALIFGTSFSLAFFVWLRPSLGRVFFGAIVAIAMVFAAISIVESHHPAVATAIADVFRHGEMQRIGERFRAGATMFHPNILGCLLSVGILVTVCMKAGGDMGWPLFAPTVCLLGSGVAMAGSRNSLLVLAIPLAILLFNHAAARTALAAMLLSAASIAVWPGSSARFAELATLPPAPPTTAPIEEGQLAPSQDYHLVGTRLLLWESAFRMWRDHPVLGVGPGVCKQAMKSYASPALYAVEKYKLDRAYLHAHNGPLDLLAECGIAGAIAGALLLLLLAGKIGRLYGLLPPHPVHALLAGFALSFVPDDFAYSFLYMVLFTSTALMCSQERSAPFRSPRPECPSSPHA